MEVYEAATGDCTVCGKSAEGSMYWTPLPDKVWKIMRPYVEPLFPVSEWSGVRLVLSIFFVPAHSKPFCGPVCSLKYHQENT